MQKESIIEVCLRFIEREHFCFGLLDSIMTQEVGRLISKHLEIERGASFPN